LNLALYVKPEKPQDEAPKRKLISKIQAGGDGFQHSKSELERGNSSKSSRSRHNKDWKGLAREAEVPTIRISEVDNAHLEEKVRPKVNRGRRSLSPKPAVQRKRDRADEQQRTKVRTTTATFSYPDLMYIHILFIKEKSIYCMNLSPYTLFVLT
jgi:hypothetical protein